MQHIKRESDYNTFMSLGWAMCNTKKDEMQGKLFVKLYAFVQEWMLAGFVGDFAYILGNDVAYYLLCYKNKFTAFRHKVTLRAQAAFDELEEWMVGKDWKEAVRKARAHRDYGQAPGLYFPAGILAMMVIDYPGSRIQDQIQSLQLE